MSQPSSGKKVEPRKELLGGLYQLGGLLGKGGFSNVYKAINVRTGETVAVKQFSTRNIPQKDLDQIMAEAELNQSLKHPNIVKFLGYIRKENFLFFVLEFVENGSVTSIMKSFGSFPEVLARVYTEQVLAGLAYLHSCDIIHRDIKGCNILVAKDGTVKLADFGVSAKMSEQDKRFSVVGTPYWMAPEVIEMTGHHTASDVWSLGCTVIELLTGEPPYFQLQSMAALFKIVQDPHPPLPASISKDLTSFLELCFIKDPLKRPSARDMLSHKWIVSVSTYGPTPSPLQRQQSVMLGPSDIQIAKGIQQAGQELADLRKQLNDLNLKVSQLTTERDAATGLLREALASPTGPAQLVVRRKMADFCGVNDLGPSSGPPLRPSISSSLLSADELDGFIDFQYSREWLEGYKEDMAASILFASPSTIS